MSLRQVQVNRRVLKMGMAKKHLYGAQIGAVLQQVGRPAVAQRMRRYGFLKPGASGGLPDCKIDSLSSNRLFLFALVDMARKQPGLWFTPAPPGSQCFQQLWRKRHIAVAIPFPFANMDDHALGVNVADA